MLFTSNFMVNDQCFWWKSNANISLWERYLIIVHYKGYWEIRRLSYRENGKWSLGRLAHTMNRHVKTGKVTVKFVKSTDRIDDPNNSQYAVCYSDQHLGHFQWHRATDSVLSSCIFNLKGTYYESAVSLYFRFNQNS